MIFALLVTTFALFGESVAFGGRKALAPTSATVGLPLIPTDLGFTPLSSKDPKVIQLAKYAIDEYNKAHNAELVFYAVLEATFTTNEEGTNYGLFVAATNGTKLSTYHMDVFVNQDVKKLISFARV